MPVIVEILAKKQVILPELYPNSLILCRILPKNSHIVTKFKITSGFLLLIGLHFSNLQGSIGDSSNLWGFLLKIPALS